MVDKIYEESYLPDGPKTEEALTLLFSLQCVRFIDYPALEKMTPSILDLIRNSVNLGTKIACAHFICLVSENVNVVNPKLKSSSNSLVHFICLYRSAYV